MNVNVSRHQLDWFRRKARNTPNEIYAVLVGKQVTPDSVWICAFRYPTLVLSTPSGVHPDEAECAEMIVEAKADGQRVLGSIHSHPSYLPVMSPQDILSHIQNNDLISGIVEVTKRRTRVVFWRHDSSLPCELTYT
jgi:proteasome lid subunit RPN8/RPN11